MSTQKGQARTKKQKKTNSKHIHSPVIFWDKSLRRIIICRKCRKDITSLKHANSGNL